MKEKIKLLSQLRQKQDKIKSVIANLEAEIILAVPDLKLEGTTKQFWGSITTKLTRKLDYNAYIALNLPEKLQFVSLTPKIDLKKLRATELVSPEITDTCITVKPAKTVIKITEAKSELK